MNEITEKWTKTKLLSRFEENRRDDIAQSLQSQFDYNQSVLNNSEFLRLSIPLLVRLYGKCPNMIGSGESFHTFYRFNTDYKTRDHVLRLEDFTYRDKNGYYGSVLGIDAEADFCSNLVEKLAVELNNLSKEKPIYVSFLTEDGYLCFSY